MGNDRRINIDELFDDSEVFDYRAERPAGEAPTGLLELEVVEGTDPGEIVDLDPQSLTISLKTEEDQTFELQLEATISNRGAAPLELREIKVILRTDTGALLDFNSMWLSTKFAKTQEVVQTLSFDVGRADRIHRIELECEVEYPFQALIATGEPGRVPLEGRNAQRHHWPVRLEPVEQTSPGAPQIDFELQLTAGIRWGDPFVACLGQLTELSPTSDFNRETVIALRDDQDRLIAKESMNFRLGGVGLPTLEKLHFGNLNPSSIARVARIDVACKGTVERVVHLGTFEVR